MARLVSPVVTSPDSDLCVSFWYHMFGSHIGTLHIKQRKQTVDGPADILLWTVSGHQGSRWREGRVLVPQTNKPYQVNQNRPFFDFCYASDIVVIFLLSCSLGKSLLSVPYFKVVIESLMDAKSWGDIAVDDIKVLSGLSMAECKGEAFSVSIYTSWIAHGPNCVSSLA